MSKKPRVLPVWMTKNKKQRVGEALSNIVGNANDSIEEKNPVKGSSSKNESTGRKLRSNFPLFNKQDKEVENLEVTWSSAEYPLIDYNGKITYLNDFVGIAEACEELIKLVDNNTSDKVGIAFDMEWTFSFKSGPEKTSVIQICADVDHCYIFHLPQIKKLPASLKLFLNHPKVILHGVNIKCDFRKLERDFPLIPAEPLIHKSLDLGQYYNSVYGSSGRWSMERLVLQVCKLRIDKNRNIRCSKWHLMPLTEDQQKYAAIDVYIGQVIYNTIAAKEKEEAQNYGDFFDVYGEELNNEVTINKNDLNNEIQQLFN
ncbi:unnamed protein product [Diamesa serratosioi]